MTIEVVRVNSYIYVDTNLEGFEKSFGFHIFSFILLQSKDGRTIPLCKSDELLAPLIPNIKFVKICMYVCMYVRMKKKKNLRRNIGLHPKS